MKFLNFAVLSAVTISTPALADPVDLKPLIDARLRYEGVDQNGIRQTADAVTMRIRAGVQATSGPFSALVEAEGLLAIGANYNSGVNGRSQFPLVADPQNIELNRAQIQYRGIRGVVATLGRQRIVLDDARFVGNLGWRQNEQTFDAIRIEWSPVKNLKVDGTYLWSIRTVYGIDGFGARPQAIGGDTFLGNVSYQTPVGRLTAFGYLIDEDETLFHGNSSQTYGARFAGSRPLAPKVKLNYVASLATQSDYGSNPNAYRAGYYFGEAGLDVAKLRLAGGYEVLGADDGRTLTSFQTPLALIHLFQGWADKFITTPPNGIKDAYGRVGYAVGDAGPLANIMLTAVYHDFTA